MHQLKFFIFRHGILLGVVLVFILGFIFSLYNEGLPTTNDAFVFAQTYRIKAQQSGTVEAIYVANNQAVKKGQKLFDFRDELQHIKPFYAQSQGIVVGIKTCSGCFESQGEALMTFIDTRRWWVQANFKETQLAGVKPNTVARIRLRMYPKHTYLARIEHNHWAVSREHVNPQSGLLEVANENQWFRLPQRFPVLLKVLNPDPNFPLHVGASASVVLNPSTA